MLLASGKLSHILTTTYFKCKTRNATFLSDPSPIIGYACHSLPDSLTDWLLFSKLDACEHCCVDPSPIFGYFCQGQAWHVKMATQNLLKFIGQRIVYSFLKLWRAFLDWNQIVKPFYSWYRLSKPRQEERQSQYFISILHVQRNELSFSFLNGTYEEIH